MQFDDRFLPAFEQHSGWGLVWWKRLGAVCRSTRKVALECAEKREKILVRRDQLIQQYRTNPTTILCPSGHIEDAYRSFLSYLHIISIDKQLIKHFYNTNKGSC
jgi:hypothetical protein